ncbi:patatin-like phospholipase family protein [Aspergillus lucknowensis]|uniref:FabD/lysophospholipase-like protein n=1 Tax=Aspergillus lucknowensis TaxID=176173 RepID=A0ABR4LRZ3_9EURO
MAKCDHISWVKFTEEKATPQLVYGSRFAQVIAELPDPSTQLPQVVFCLGRRLKDQALRELCGSNYRGQHRLQRCINLRSDNRTLHSLQPRFFADCDPTREPLPASPESMAICHLEQVHGIDLAKSTDSLYDLVLARLLFLYVDVLCIFADDMGGLEGVRERLSTWARIGSASSLPNVVRPRVIVVTGEQSQSVTHNILEEGDFLYDLLHVGDLPFYAVFGDVQVCRLPPGEHSSEARYLGLHQEVTQQLRNMRSIREQQQVLFSAKHLNSFFELSIQHFSTEPFVPFNYIKAARQWNPLDGAFTSHLISFLETGKHAPYDEMASYIASAILMDAYPNRAHPFAPSAVFKTLYHDACSRAFQHCYRGTAIVSTQCKKVEGQLKSFFEEMTTNSTPSWELHRRNLSTQKKFWTHHRSNKTCLVCLRRQPEHMPTCGHAICDTCTEIFGEPVPHAESEYIVRQCVVCSALVCLTVKLKPPTAAPRVLSIDGGGPRAVIPLEHLEILQEILGPDLPVGDFFELKVGTSSGGLIVLSITLRCLDITQSFSLRRKWPGSWLHDERYDSTLFDDVLKEHYTPTQRLFDTPASMVSSGKVAVTATSLDGDQFIFTNYNGTAPRQLESVYERLRPEVESEPFVWQVARSTAAAPSLFSTTHLPGLGSFQDGGIPRYNNPASVAELEVKHLWPGAEPDVFITLGTGTGLRSSKPFSFRNIIADGWISRVYRAVQRTFDGRLPWLEQYARLDENAKDHYFRFDSSFRELPAMDDTKCMEYLSDQTRIQSSWQNSSEAVLTLLISSFFFTLDVLPEFRSGFFHCKGTIRSRCAPEPLIRKLSQLEPSRQDFFKDQLNLGLYLSPVDICPSCHQYSLAVRFYVRNLDEKITLSLQLGTKKHRLSAFPKSIHEVVDEQGLDAPFGLSNHDIPLHINCPTCATRVSTQRKKRKFSEI